MLTGDDLHHDAVLVRKIRRMQQAKAREAEDSDAEKEERQISLSQQPTPSLQAHVKISSSSRSQIASGQEAVQSSIVDDLGSPSDEHDE